MTLSYIDATTLQPARLGELYGDRDLKLVGQLLYNSTNLTVQTQGLSLVSSPKGGGALAYTAIPNGSYSLPAVGSSIWVQVNRVSGTVTAVLGTSIIAYGASAQPTPSQDWMQLFVNANGTILALGGFVVPPAAQYSTIGYPVNTTFDIVVGPSTDPRSQFSTIQAAVNAAVDGNTILVLPGTYSITAAGNAGVDNQAAIAWSGKTLTIEGSGFQTILVDNFGFLRAFNIQSTSSTLDASNGNGSSVSNLQLQGFQKSFLLSDTSSSGIRNVKADVWITNSTTPSVPTAGVTGTALTSGNTVVERLQTVGSVYKKMEHYITGSDTETIERNANLVSFYGSSLVAALTVQGAIQSTAGSLVTPASYMGILDTSGALTALKANSLVLSSSASDTAPGTPGLLCQGPATFNTSVNFNPNGGAVTVNQGSSATAAFTITSAANVAVQSVMSRTANTPVSWDNYIPAGSTSLIWSSSGFTNMSLDTSGDLSLLGSLNVTSGAAIGGTLTAPTVNVSGTLTAGTVTATTFNATNFGVTNLTVSGTATMNGNLVSNATTSLSTTNVSGVLTANSTFTVNGTTNINGTLNINTATTTFTNLGASGPQNGNNWHPLVESGGLVSRGPFYQSGNTSYGNTLVMRDASGGFYAGTINLNSLVCNSSSGITMNGNQIYLGSSNANPQMGSGQIVGSSAIKFTDGNGNNFWFGNGRLYCSQQGGNNPGLLQGHNGNAHSFGWLIGSGGTGGDGTPAGTGQSQLDFYVDTTRVLSIVFNSIGGYAHVGS